MINKVILIFLIGSSLIYSLYSGIQCVYIRTWVTNTDTPVIYGIKRLNKILKSQ